jgi:hypothetical protein
VTQDIFKAQLRPLLRDVATAFSQSEVELWAMDEHRIGLKPILQKVWCVDGQRPMAPVQRRYDWRYLVGFVHTASGRTVFHLAKPVEPATFVAHLQYMIRFRQIASPGSFVIESAPPAS